MWVLGTELSARAATVVSSLWPQPWDILLFPKEHILQELMRVKDKEINPDYGFANWSLEFQCKERSPLQCRRSTQNRMRTNGQYLPTFCFLTKLCTQRKHSLKKKSYIYGWNLNPFLCRNQNCTGKSIFLLFVNTQASRWLKYLKTQVQHRCRHLCILKTGVGSWCEGEWGTGELQMLEGLEKRGFSCDSHRLRNEAPT